MYPAPEKIIRSFFVLNDDLSAANARRAYWLHLALKKNGLRSFWRDTTDVHTSLDILNEAGLAKHHEIEGFIITTKMTEMAFFGWIDAILSFDQEWYSSQTRYTTYDGLKKIAALWSSPFLDAAKRASYADKKIPLEITSEKVFHFHSSQARLEEGEILGLKNLRCLPSAAPSAFLTSEATPDIKDKILFIGSPEFSFEANERIDSQSLDDLHSLALEEILRSPSLDLWEKDCPGIRTLVEETAKTKASSPSSSTLSLLKKIAEKLSLPLDWNTLLPLEYADLAASILKYDRPHLIHALQKRNLLDVYGDVEKWNALGMEAQPAPKWSELHPLFGRYPAYLHLPSSRSEEGIAEEAFQAAACARVPIGIKTRENHLFESHDHSCELASELPDKVASLLSNPTSLLDDGREAREWVRHGHTWEHRIQRIMEEITA